MNVYIYAADIYCEDCGEAIRKQLYRTPKACVPLNRDDERSYDSDDFPKGPYPNGGGKADYPQHCGAGADCLNAIELSDGTKIGAWLENELTAWGVDYVQEAIQEGNAPIYGEVAEMWAGFYRDYEGITP